MFKKGLITLVCLTVMSALWAFGAGTYSVSTKITSLGTKLENGVYVPVVGGSIKTHTATEPDTVIANHTNGVMYTTVLSAKDVEADVTAADGYKISSLTKTTAGVTETLVTSAENLTSYTATFSAPVDGKTQFLVATFAIATDSSVVSKTWQLQLQNNNSGGKISYARGPVSADYTTVGKLFAKNFLDTTPVTVTVTPAAGYNIDYVIVDGVKQFLGTDVAKVVNVDPTVGRLKSVVAGYKKKAIQITTANIANGGGIAPLNPVADPYGNVRLIITPQNGANVVQSVTTTGGTLTLTDRFGAPISLPYTGSVKATITGLQAPITAVTVSATYATNYAASGAVTNCTNTCHIDPALVAAKPYVKAAGDEWATSKHASTTYARVDCIACHQSMPGPELTPALCATCHSSKATSAHAVGTGHTTGTCQRCHTGDGARNGAETGWTGGYADVLSVNTYVPVTAANGIGCTTCHNPHNGELLGAKTTVAGAVVAWNPNGNASTNDQYDVCTSCHTLTDNAGTVVGNYHNGGSISIERTITDSHFDNPATAGATYKDALGNTVLGKVEGYVIRANSANPCADCHNLHGSDTEIQKGWAKSAHAGKIADKKEQALYDYAAAQGAADPAGPFTPESTGPWGYGGSTVTYLEKMKKTAGAIAAVQAAGATDDADGNAWTHYPWAQASRAACQRCHTATGLSNFLNAPGSYVAANNNFSHLAAGQQELLYCWGCHSDTQSGALRNPGGLTISYSNGASATFADAGKSNVCIACHSGRENQDSITNSTADFANTGFLNSHYLAAAGTLYNKGGYEFAGQSYDNLGYHKNVGNAADGPCVTCHMSGAESHSFEVSAASAACASCHGGLTDAAIAAAKVEFHEALEALNAALLAKGIEFKPAHPYFYVPGTTTAFTNWDGVYPGKGKDVMGAAFNFNLLDHEPGAFAHNRNYSLKLIQDSIDFLADGAVDGNGTSATVAAVMASKEFAEATSHPAAVVAAANSTNCAACHQSAPHYTTDVANQAAFVAQQMSCTDCHANGDTSANAQILVQYAESAHGDVNGAAWTSEEMFNNSCAKCHSTSGFITGGAPATAFTAGESQQVLACSGCHTSVVTGEVRAKGQITVAYQSKTIVAGVPTLAPAVFPNVGETNNLCIACHSGRESGQSVKALSDAGMNNVGFKNPHYLGAAGMMYAKLGYNFAADDAVIPGTATTYISTLTTTEDGGTLSSTHRKFGTPAMSTDTHGLTTLVEGGPCVSCHMVPNAANAGKPDHTWEINGNSFEGLCVNCHSAEGATTLTAENFKEVFIEEQALPYQDAIALAEAKLLTYGIKYTDAYPYFVDTAAGNVPAKDWTRGGTLTAAEAKNLMGAAFNIKLMKADPAAYVHARTYARRVLYDTIDWLDNKALDLSTGATALAWDPVKYVKGADSNAAETTESYRYLAGYNRTTYVWNAVERP